VLLVHVLLLRYHTQVTSFAVVYALYGDLRDHVICLFWVRTRIQVFHRHFHYNWFNFKYQYVTANFRYLFDIPRHTCASSISPTTRTVTRGVQDASSRLEKCVGHSLKNLGPYQKTICPHDVPSWLQKPANYLRW